MAKLKTFLVLYHAPASALKKMQNVTPEEAKKGMEGWYIWAKKCGKRLVDMGTPLGGGIKIKKDGASPSKRNVAGYSIIKAENMAGAKKLLKGHPHLMWVSGCEIEVHESLPMPG